jgi:hypothetical protein
MATDLATTVSRWQQGAAAGQTRYVEGVQATTKDVTGLAVRAQSALLANFNDAVNSGRWARNLQAVGTQGWKDKSVAKAGNYSTGIAAGSDNYSSAMQTWLPRIQQAAASVSAMPSGTLALNLARANAFATALYNAKRGR